MEEIHWQNFERLSRSVVRGWGFQVSNVPQKKYSKFIDVYGVHIAIKKAIVKGAPQKQLEFIGECKSWEEKVDIDIIDQLVGYRENFILDKRPTITAVISKNGFTDRAVERSKNQDILIIDYKKLVEVATATLYQKGIGSISRTSFPFYQSLSCLFAVIDCMFKNGFENEWNSSNIEPFLMKHDLWKNKSGNPYSKKMITDHLNVLTLLGIINWTRKENRKLQFKLDKMSVILLENEVWKTDLIEIMKLNAVKLPWVREIILALQVNDIITTNEIYEILTNTQPGFDKESIKFSFKLMRDLELVDEKHSLKPNITNYLWRKMELEDT